MKTVKLSAIAMASIIFVSCGTTKQSQQTQYPNYGGYQPQQPQGYYQQQLQSPQNYYQSQPLPDEKEIRRRELEELARENPCKYLAELGSENDIRVYGEGVGFDASAARLEAEIDAQRQLVNELYEVASSVIKQGSQNQTANPLSAVGARVTKLDFESFAEGSLAGYRILLSKEERTTGGVICKMCISLSNDKAIQSTLDRVQKNYVINDIAEFQNNLAENIREKYRKQTTGTNQQEQQQEIDFNRQIQQSNLNFQQEQQRTQQQQNYNLQQQQQQYNYQLQQQQQNNNFQLQQQRNYQQQQNYNNQPQQNNNYQLLQQNNYQ